ncbi:MAG TPA: alpha/beta hydrolase [Longimicrobium sp.]|nr:alpha/beta hydrolase [Longimicrobium sp.]
MKRRIRRILIAFCVLLVAAAVVGGVYESVTRRSAAREFPAPGKLVDVGGRRMQIDCRGAGLPTVVLESGLDHFGSLSWAPVHDSLARTTRVCAYSRAGIMWSDAAGGRFDSGRMAADLHTALSRAGERPPWVLVGHSMGGPYALAFTGRYGAEVAGLVFVDASHPDQMQQASGGRPPFRQRVRDAGINVAGPVLLRLGAARLVSVNNAPPAAPEMIAAHRAYFPTSVATLIEENRAIEATLRTAGRHRRLGDRPLVVLTGARRTPPQVLERSGVTEREDARRRAAWKRLHDDQATWSTRARHEVVDDASHYIHRDRPDVVIRAVRQVVAAVREPDVPPAQRPKPATP